MFESVKPVPADPILGLMEKFRAEQNPNKIDLGVGVYKDEQGRTPVLDSVKQAEELVHQHEDSKGYIDPAGDPETNLAMQKLLLGEDSQALKDQRVATLQTPGGCGALSLAARMSAQANGESTVWVSNPTWGNHLPLIGAAGLGIKEYSYYDPVSKGVNFDRMMSDLETASSGDLLLLHGCCHNPSGADLSPDQWQDVALLMLRKGIVPWVDLAYQGFGEGIEEDCFGLRLLAEQLPEMMLASSCSKNFGLYRERTGTLSIVTKNSGSSAAVKSQLAKIARETYSMPPSHGAAIVGMILGTQPLRQLWEKEVGEMRWRIGNLRHELALKLNKNAIDRDFSFINEQRGMFSLLGLPPDQVRKLADDYGIYLVASSRISVPGINSTNVDYLAEAIIATLGSGDT